MGGLWLIEVILEIINLLWTLQHVWRELSELRELRKDYGIVKGLRVYSANLWNLVDLLQSVLLFIAFGLWFSLFSGAYCAMPTGAAPTCSLGCCLRC